jgi:hypothetical protein
VSLIESLQPVDEPGRALDEAVRVARRWLLVSVPREPLWRGINVARRLCAPVGRHAGPRAPLVAAGPDPPARGLRGGRRCPQPAPVDARARLDPLRLAERAAVAVVAAAGLIGWLTFPVLPTYDSLSALVWGRDILDGHLPGFDAYAAPTEHPLWVAAGTALALLGDAGARAMTLLTIASLVALVIATYRLGRTAFGPLAGGLAAALLLTRLDFGFYAAFAFLDVTFAALIVWAAALEAERPRRGGLVWLLLVLAGLLRPEGWVYAAAYSAWLWIAGGRARRALPAIVAWVAAAPVLWMLTDLVVTGRPLFSWTYTTGEAAILGRHRTPAQVPHAVLQALDELLKLPVLLLAALGLALALRERRGLRLRVPLALLALGLVTFALVVLGGVSGQVPRYASVAAVGLLLFAGYLFARLLRVPSGGAGWLAWTATIAIVVGGVAWTAARLHPHAITSLLRFRHGSRATSRRRCARRSWRGPAAAARWRSRRTSSCPPRAGRSTRRPGPSSRARTRGELGAAPPAWSCSSWDRGCSPTRATGRSRPTRPTTA